jgi:hyperosmotically inducible periplasmic protein
MKLFKILMAVAIVATVSFTSCKPKDADIKANIEEVIKKDAMMSSTTVEVKDGVATITGECKDAECKAMCEKNIAAVKGVKSVVNNCSVKPVVAPPASLTTTLDAATQQKVKDGLKDMKTVTLAGFSGTGAIINGEVSAAENMKIKQMLASAKVMLDATSKLTIKK